MTDTKCLMGTSGWHYAHWKGPFYPSGTDPEDYLDYYGKHFQTVEVNNSFYQLPDENTLKDWRQEVPEEFIFSVKASRYITHMKKLKDPEEPVKNFIDRVTSLGKHLGPILFQLPPNWRPNYERLEEFLQLLPQGFRYVFEFRDQRWFADELFTLLQDHQAAFCIYHLEGYLSPREVTTDFIYIRLHGPNAAYKGKYSPSELAGWAGAISTWTRRGKTVYCYFDNDEKGFAPQNASELKAMLQA